MRNEPLSETQRHVLLAQALEETEMQLLDRKFPYKMKVKYSEDGTRASVVMRRGNCLVITWTFIMGFCILGIICQKCLFPWFRWDMYIVCDPRGKLTMKFHANRGRLMICITCILTSWVLAYFSNEEYKDVRKITFDACQTASNIYFGDEEDFVINDLSHENIQDMFFDRSEKLSEEEFLKKDDGEAFEAITQVV